MLGLNYEYVDYQHMRELTVATRLLRLITLIAAHPNTSRRLYVTPDLVADKSNE